MVNGIGLLNQIWRLSVKVGDLVAVHGITGLVLKMGEGSHLGYVYVSWLGLGLKPEWDSISLLEVISEGR